jgi:hypothetical protein
MNQKGPRLGEPASLWRMRIVPIASVMFASALPLMLPLIANSPVLPPLGLLFFLCWQLLRAEMWPVWIGLPLGLWDDLFSGAPIGTAMGFLPRLGDCRSIYRDHSVARRADHAPARRDGPRARPCGAADHRLGAARPAVHAPDRQV